MQSKEAHPSCPEHCWQCRYAEVYVRKTERIDETMLLYPAMKDLLKNVPSRYLLVNLVASRARKISSEAEREGIHLEEKPVTIAIEEVANGMLRPETAEFSEAASQETESGNLDSAEHAQMESAVASEA